MSQPDSILVFAGSTRVESLNRKLALAAAKATNELGVPVTHIELRDYPLPLYDGDHESLIGTPAHALALRSLLKRHSIWLIASPNYNSSMSPLLKNMIDWVSRPVSGEDYLAVFKNRVVLLMSSAAGSSGGVRGLPHLRQVLAYLGARVLDEQFAVPRGPTAFDAAGGLIDADQQRSLLGLIQLALASSVTQRTAIAEIDAA